MQTFLVKAQLYLKFTLTKTLRPFTTPVSRALAGKYGGKGKLVTLITVITNARPPLEISPNHLPIRDAGRCTTHNGCDRKETISHVELVN